MRKSMYCNVQGGSLLILDKGSETASLEKVTFEMRIEGVKGAIHNI